MILHGSVLYFLLLWGHLGCQGHCCASVALSSNRNQDNCVTGGEKDKEDEENEMFLCAFIVSMDVFHRFHSCLEINYILYYAYSFWYIASTVYSFLVTAQVGDLCYERTSINRLQVKAIDNVHLTLSSHYFRSYVAVSINVCPVMCFSTHLLLTSPDDRTLFMYSRKDSSLISLSVKMKLMPLPCWPAVLYKPFRSSIRLAVL